MSEERDRKLENTGDRRLNLRMDEGRNIDLFVDARKCIGLFPVKARHILDFNEGDYDISPEDIPQLPDLRLIVAKEFLLKELKWKRTLR